MEFLVQNFYLHKRIKNTGKTFRCMQRQQLRARHSGTSCKKKKR